MAVGRQLGLQRVHGSRPRTTEEVVVRLVGCLGRVREARALLGSEDVLGDHATVARELRDAEPDAAMGKLAVIVVVVSLDEGGIE